MKVLFEPIFAKFNALSLRERLFVLVGIAVLIYGALDRLALAPQLAKRKQAEQEITRLTNSNNEWLAKVAATPQSAEYDPDEPLRERIQMLNKDLADLEQHLDKAAVNLNSPGEMAKVLEEFVGQQSDLRLVGLRSLGAEPVSVEGGSKEVVRLFKHGVSIQVVGSYDGIRRYLRALETSHWRLYWENIEIKTEHYPKIMATLGVYTLGLSDNWLSL